MPRLLALLTLAFVNLSQPAFGMRVQAAAQNGLEERLTNALRRPGTGLEETPTVDWNTVARFVDALEWYLQGESELRQTLHKQIEAGISEQGALDDVRQALEDQDPNWLRTELEEVLTAVNAKVQKGYAGFLVYQIEQIFKALPAGAKSLLPDLGQTTPPDQVARNVQVWAALLHTLSAMPEWIAPLDSLDLQRNKKFLDAQQAGFDIPHLHYLLKPLNGIPDHDIVVVTGLIFDELAQNSDAGQDPQRLLEVVQKRSRQVSDATFAHPEPLASAQPLDELVVQTLITRARRLVGLPTAGLEEDESLSYDQVLILLQEQHPSLITLKRPALLEDTQPLEATVNVYGLSGLQVVAQFQVAARKFLGAHGPDHLGTWRYGADILDGHATITARSRAGLEELRPTAVLEQPAPAAGPTTGIEVPPGAVERPELGVIQTPDGGTIVPELPKRPVSLGTEILLTAVTPLETLGRMAWQIPAAVRQQQPLYVLDDEAVSAAAALERLQVPFLVVARTPAIADALRNLGVPQERIREGSLTPKERQAFKTLSITPVVVKDLKTLRTLLHERGFDLPALRPLLVVYDRAVQAAAEYLQAML